MRENLILPAHALFYGAILIALWIYNSEPSTHRYLQKCPSPPGMAATVEYHSSGRLPVDVVCGEVGK